MTTEEGLIKLGYLKKGSDKKDAVRAFQMDYSDSQGNPLTVDGIDGPKTLQAILEALDTQPDKLWCTPIQGLKKQAEEFLKIPTQDWKLNGKQAGHNSEFAFFPFVPKDGVYMLIKETKPPARYDRSYLRSFSASAIIVKILNRRLELVGTPFKVSTHTGQQTTSSAGTPDVNNDRVADIAWLIEHVAYRFEGRRKGSKMRFNPVDYVTPVHRDYQSKGWIDEEEHKRIFSATATQYHDDGGAGVPVSVGCITAPLVAYNRSAKWIESTRCSYFTTIFRYY